MLIESHHGDKQKKAGVLAARPLWARNGQISSKKQTQKKKKKVEKRDIALLEERSVSKSGGEPRLVEFT